MLHPKWCGVRRERESCLLIALVYFFYFFLKKSQYLGKVRSSSTAITTALIILEAKPRRNKVTPTVSFISMHRENDKERNKMFAGAHHRLRIKTLDELDGKTKGEKRSSWLVGWSSSSSDSREKRKTQRTKARQNKNKKTAALGPSNMRSGEKNLFFDFF